MRQTSCSFRALCCLAMPYCPSVGTSSPMHRTLPFHRIASQECTGSKAASRRVTHRCKPPVCLAAARLGSHERLRLAYIRAHEAEELPQADGRRLLGDQRPHEPEELQLLEFDG